MTYEFGDILDARNAPKPLEHFLIVLGETTKNEVMYYIATSRVYAVFNNILDFFNDCINNKYKRFFHYFNKEKGKQIINPHGRLTDALFLDKDTHYNLSLDVNSMIVVNSDPQLVDKIVLNKLCGEGRVSHRDKLAVIDLHKLSSIIKHSKNISPSKLSEINANFNKVMKKKNKISHS